MKTLITFLYSATISFGAPMGLQERQDDGCIDNLTPEILEQMMTSPEGVEQCGPTADQGDGTLTCAEAHPFIVSALNQYGFTSCDSIAYYLSYLSFESVSLMWVTNQSHMRPGQGTYSMMMPDNLGKFVEANQDIDLPQETRDYAENNELNLEKLGLLDGLPKNATDDQKEIAQQLNEFREPLLAPEIAFLPAAWYYSDATTIDECKGAIGKMDTEEGVRDVLLGCTGVGEGGIDERVERHNVFLTMLTGETPADEVDGPVEEDTSDPVEEEEVDTPVEQPDTPPADDAAPVTPPGDGADPVTPPPVEGTDPVTPPADGEEEVDSPAEGPVTPPADGTDPVTPPADGADPVTPPSDGTGPVTPPPSEDTNTPKCTLSDAGQPTCLADRTQIYLCSAGQWVGMPLPDGTMCTCTQGDGDGCPGVIGWAA